MSKVYAPILLFTYCRMKNTKETVEHLLDNNEARDSDLIVFSDAPKNDKVKEGVLKTRKYLYSITGFKSITIIEREKNLGLAKNIVNGVTSMVNKYGRVIVMEDDLNVSPFFLKYMNEGLDRYENREDIISICGYMYPINKMMPEAMLIKGADCWGWATWKRGWDLFSFDAKTLYYWIVDNKKEREFEFNNSYPYIQMLRGQVYGKANSWAICWYASAFINDKYTVYPGHSLVCPNDIDGIESTHGSSFQYNSLLKDSPINWDFAEDQTEYLEGRDAFEAFFRSNKSPKDLSSQIKNLVIKIVMKSKYRDLFFKIMST